jgi:hypothetical protein
VVVASDADVVVTRTGTPASVGSDRSSRRNVIALDPAASTFSTMAHGAGTSRIARRAESTSPNEITASTSSASSSHTASRRSLSSSTTTT